MSDFRTLARQAATALEPGDYLELIVARPGSPSIKLAQTIKTASAEETRHIDTVLASIRAEFLSTASIANALDVAFARLNEVSSKRGIAAVTVIVFTRCEISSDEARRILAVADRFNGRNWVLYLTGTRNTNRDILLAANRHTLKWSSISEANPALWLAKKEPEGPPAEKKEEPTPAPKPPEPAKPDSLMPTQPGEPQMIQDEPQKYIAGPRQAQTPQSPGYRVTTQIDSTVSFPPVTQLPGSEATTPPLALPSEVNALPEPAPEQVVAEPAEAKPPQEEVAVPQRSFWSRVRGAVSSYWWLILLLIAALGVLILVISRDVLKAGRWDMQKKEHLASASRDPKRLIARYGDDYRDLGRLDHFRSIHVGPGKKNTIRTADSTGGERYLRLYRRGDDVMLKNLANSSVLANNIEVKPGRKQRLVIPSAIQLPDKTKLNLDFVRPDTKAAQTERNASHGRSTEPQRVG
jgi:hypothetical protein